MNLPKPTLADPHHPRNAVTRRQRREAAKELHRADYFAALWADPDVDPEQRKAEMRRYLGQYYPPEAVDTLAEEDLLELFEATHATFRANHKHLTRLRRPATPPPEIPITDTASWQRALDKHYARRPPIKPRRRVRPAAPRPRRRQRESATHSRAEIRSTKDEARGPPPGTERTRKGAGPTSCPPPSLSTTTLPYADRCWPAITPWISIGDALSRLLLRLGYAPSGHGAGGPS